MLPQMTPKQRQKANALIKRLCANYDNGSCLLLDDGEFCVCPQTISYSLLCKYFRAAVLPAEPLLEATILNPDGLVRCAQCKKSYVQEFHNQKYCKDCAKCRYRKQQAEYAARKRAGQSKK